ncbi:transposable element Tcb1 transposase [Trichonephila clavipes]|nr:transposable element Tcb1 transposase [Trichonephila clavipes]
MNQGYQKCLTNYYSANIAASGPPKQTLPVRVPMLTAVHRRRKAKFARQYSSWTSTEWRQVAFSDESFLCSIGQMDVEGETSERNHPATIAGTVQAEAEHYGLGNVSWHSLGSLITVGRHDGSIQVRICPCGPCPHLHADCFSSG